MPTEKVVELRPRDGRLPPHDLNAEASVLSAMLLDPTQVDVVAGILRARDFYSDANKQICECIFTLAAERVEIDLTTVAGWLHDRGLLDKIGGAPYLAMIQDETPAVSHVADHAKRVFDKAKVRRFIAALHQLAATGYGDYGDATEFVQAGEALIAEIATEGRRQELRQVGQIMREHVASLDENRRRGVHLLGKPSGFRKLDEQTGGMFAGDLIVVAGRPGMGKTSFAISTSGNFTRPERGETVGDGVAFFSLEMPAAQMAARFTCAMHQLDFMSVRTNSMNDMQFVKLLEATQEMLKLPVWIDDTAAINLLELRARTVKLSRDIETERAGVPCKKLGLVVVDYLQLMTGKGDNREQEVAGITRGLKKLAKDLDVTVMAVSQLNRRVEQKGGSKRPQLSDLRESGAIEQDADSVWFVHRQSYYDDDAPPGEAEVDVAKQRNGPTGTVRVGFRGPSMGFHDFAGEEIDEFDEFDDVPYIG